MSRSADGPSLLARIVYRVPNSELQTKGIGVMGDSIVLSAEPRRDRNASSSRNSEKDKAVGRESTVKGKTVLIQILRITFLTAQRYKNVLFSEKLICRKLTLTSGEEPLVILIPPQH